MKKVVIKILFIIFMLFNSIFFSYWKTWNILNNNILSWTSDLSWIAITNLSWIKNNTWLAENNWKNVNNILSWINFDNKSNINSIISKKKGKILKIFEKSEIDKKIEQEKLQWKITKIKSEILKNINSEILSWLTKNKEILNKLYRIKEKFEKSNIEKNKLNKIIDYLNKKIQQKGNKIKELQQIIENNKKQISLLKTKSTNYNILLEQTLKIKQKIEQKNKEAERKKFIFFAYILTAYFLLLFIIKILEKKLFDKKKKDNVLILIKKIKTIYYWILIFILFYFIISINPKLIYAIFFMAWTILVISSHIIWNYISSFFLLWKMNPWSVIENKEWKMWIIKNIWLISVEIEIIENWKITNKTKFIPNKDFFLKEYIIHKNNKNVSISNLESFENENKKLKIKIPKEIYWKELNKLENDIKEVLNSELKKKINNNAIYDINYELNWDNIEMYMEIMANKSTERRIIIKIYNIINEYIENIKENNKEKENSKEEKKENNKEEK